MSGKEIDGTSRFEAFRHAEALGPVIESFRPALANMMAGVVLGLLALGAGGAILVFVGRGLATAWREDAPIPWFADGRFSWGLGAFFSFLALALMAGGVALILWMRRLSSLVVVLRPDGFSCETMGGVEVFPWSDVGAIRETVMIEHLPIVNGVARRAMPTRTNRSYIVQSQNGASFAFTGDTLREIDRWGSILRVEAERRGIEWQVVEVRD